MKKYQKLWADFKKSIKSNKSKTAWGKVQLVDEMNKMEMEMLRNNFKEQ